MGVNSRRKGIDGELEACRLWRPYFSEVRRSFGQSRQGYEQPDLMGGMIERSFFIEVKRIKAPPAETQIDKWELKLLADSNKYVSLGGEKPDYLVLMWRADGRKGSPQKWRVSFRRRLNIDKREDFIRTTWGDFETQINERFGLS